MALWLRARCAWTVGFALAACTLAPTASDDVEPVADMAAPVAVATDVEELQLAAPLPEQTPPEWVQRIETRSTGRDAGLIDLTVQSLQPLYRVSETDDALFAQIRMAGRAQNDSPAAVSNVGVGYRWLVDSDLLAGVNGFYDRDWVDASHRLGADGEIKWRAVDLTLNTYLGLNDESGNGAHALDGYDLRFAAQLPYLPWAQAQFSTRTFFAGDDENDRTGYATGIRLALIDNLNLSAGVRGTGAIDEAGYVGLTWKFGAGAAPRSGNRHLLSGDPIAPAAFEPRDLSQHLLDKVNRIDSIERSY